MEKLLFVFMLVCCAACQPKIFTLQPTDKRPIESIEISDGDEAALLEQQVGLEIHQVTGNKLYYYSKGAALNKRLSDLGYRTEPADIMQVNFRVVEISLNNKAPADSGVLERYRLVLLNKETRYWIVRGSLEQLSKLQNAGYVLKAPKEEPRPREVEIVVPGIADVQTVNSLGVDIFSTRQMNDKGVIIYGAAFDGQIERLQRLGFTVTRKR